MKKRNVLQDVVNVFGYAMALLFIGMGLYLIFAKNLGNMQKELRTIMGVVILTYGLFRSVIIYQKRNESKYEEEDE